MNAKEEARAALIDELLLLLDHKSAMTLARIKAEAYAAECVAEAREPLVEALRGVEWIAPTLDSPTAGDPLAWCPSCFEKRRYGHASDCQLAAALAAKETP